VSRRASLVLQRQAEPRAAYKTDPALALIRKRARTVWSSDDDALHGTIAPGDGYGITWHFGIDRAVGGEHDAPNPGELLCAALAACQHAAIRMVADALGIVLMHLEVEAIGTVDVRGSLAIDRSVPVGFARFDCRATLALEPGADPRVYERLLVEAERSCINLATLRAGVPVTLAFNLA